MATWVAIMTVTPVIFLLWLSWWPMPSRLGMGVQFIALIAFAIAVASASLWQPSLIWWAAALAAATFILFVSSVGKWPQRSSPETVYGWFGVTVLSAIVACACWITYLAIMTNFWPSAGDLNPV